MSILRTVLAVAMPLVARPVLAQGPVQVGRPASGVLASPAVTAFRKGLELSIDGASWSRARTLALPASRCVPATQSPCSPDTPALIIDIRFPSLPAVIDGSKALAQLGEAGPAVNHYFVRPVPANAAGTVCGGGFAVPAPTGAMRLAINLGSPGTPLPVTCRWTALAGVPDPGSPIGFDMVWTDTVVVQVVAKP